MLKNFPVFLIVFSGLLSVKRVVAHNEIETALEVLCSSKLNFQFLEMNFQNERTVRLIFKSWKSSLHLMARSRCLLSESDGTYRLGPIRSVASLVTESTWRLQSSI